MNTKFVIWIIAGLLFGAILFGVLWYITSAPRVVPQSSSQSSTTLPISESSVILVSSPSATSSQPAQTFAIVVQDGSTVAANDFIHNGVTIPDAANPGRYLLAGNLGYCISNPQQCQAAPTANFNVYYNSVPQSFTIALTQEPIGQARLDMEQFMFATLGLTQKQMCSLNYLVGVTIYVNAQYVGKNLGFSFCPGATPLPQQ